MTSRAAHNNNNNKPASAGFFLGAKSPTYMKHTLQRADFFRSSGGGGRHAWYILDDNRNPVPADGLYEAAAWIEAENRKPVGVSKSQVGFKIVPGYGYLSTAFLGLDHNWSGGEPILFETLWCAS